MDELITFLSARLDEDEQLAKRADEQLAALGNTWRSLTDGLDHRSVHDLDAVWDHVEQNGSARVLADVASKRAIVAAFEQRERESYVIPQGEVFGYHATGLLIAIRHLAAAYTDHPDYREQWRP